MIVATISTGTSVTKTGITITERALLRRLNRALAPKWRRLHKSRPRQISNLGDFYCLCTYTNTLVDWGLDTVRLVEWARELGVVQACETVREEV